MQTVKKTPSWIEERQRKEFYEFTGKAALNHLPHHSDFKDLEDVVAICPLVAPECAKTVLALLSVDCFFLDANKAVFEAVQNCRQKGKPIDLLFVNLELMPKAHLFPNELPAAYLVDLMNRVASTANVEYWCQCLLDRKLKADLNKAAYSIIKNVQDFNLSAHDVLAEAKSDIMQSETQRDKKLASNTSFLALVQDSFELKEGDGYDFTNFLGYQVGQKLGLWARNEVSVIAGRPGSGKTSLILQALLEMAYEGRKVVFASYEMSKTRVLQRAICQRAEIDFEKWKRGNLSPQEQQAILRITQELEDLDFEILDMVGEDVNALSYKLEEINREAKIFAVGIDYLGIIPTPSNLKFFGATDSVTYNSNAIRLITKKLDVQTILGVQLNRASEKDRRRPNMSDLRDSGAIEQDAHRIVFVHRDEYFGITEYEQTECTEEGEPTAKKALLVVAKHRDGKTGLCKVSFIGQYTKFSNVDTFDFERYSSEVSYAPKPKFETFELGDDIPF